MTETSPDNPFTKMQREFYAKESAKWTLTDRNPVVGPWEEHNAWPDYDLLFDGLTTKEMIALDFGCGPGRMMAKYFPRFGIIDGADIDVTNLVNARLLFQRERPGRSPRLYHVNGVELNHVPAGYYDLVYSAITLQHIPVYSIRLRLIREFFRVLNQGGWFTAQMGFGVSGDPRGHDYHSDEWSVGGTNGYHDVKVTDPEQLRNDLAGVGFVDFTYSVRPAGPDDWHPEWIWFRGRKP